MEYFLSKKHEVEYAGHNDVTTVLSWLSALMFVGSLGFLLVWGVALGNAPTDSTRDPAVFMKVENCEQVADCPAVAELQTQVDAIQAQVASLTAGNYTFGISLAYVDPYVSGYECDISSSATFVGDVGNFNGNFGSFALTLCVDGDGDGLCDSAEDYTVSTRRTCMPVVRPLQACQAWECDEL